MSGSIRYDQSDVVAMPEYNPNMSMASLDNSKLNESQAVIEPRFFRAFYSRVERGVNAELDKINKKKTYDEDIQE